MHPPFLSFPPGLLSVESVRIPVVAHSNDWVALQKPAHCRMTESETASDNQPFNLVQTIRQRIVSGAPAFTHYFSEEPSPIYHLEKECIGPILFARSKESLSALKEIYGSNLWKLKFLLYTRSARESDSIECNLPIAVNPTSGESYISHRKGKKAETSFTCLGRGDGLQLWEATASYLRPRQIRLHAAESGLQIAGENEYGALQPPISRQDLPGKRRRGDSRNQLWSGPAYYLSRLELEDGTILTAHPGKILNQLSDLLLEGSPEDE